MVIPFEFAADLDIRKGQYLAFRIADGIMVIKPLPRFPTRYLEGRHPRQDGRVDPPGRRTGDAGHSRL